MAIIHPHNPHNPSPRNTHAFTQIMPSPLDNSETMTASCFRFNRPQCSGKTTTGNVLDSPDANNMRHRVRPAAVNPSAYFSRSVVERRSNTVRTIRDLNRNCGGLTHTKNFILWTQQRFTRRSAAALQRYVIRRNRDETETSTFTSPHYDYRCDSGCILLIYSSYFYDVPLGDSTSFDKSYRHLECSASFPSRIHSEYFRSVKRSYRSALLIKHSPHTTRHPGSCSFETIPEEDEHLLTLYI